MKRELYNLLSFDKVKGLFSGDSTSTPRIASIGMFDGVHVGHRRLIDFMKSEGEKRGLTPTAVTFADHPLRVVRPADAPPLLCSADHKVALLNRAGIHDVVMLEFNERLRHLKASQFLRLLHDQYKVRALVIGFNHHMGSDRIGSIEEYRAIGREVGVEILAAPEFLLKGETVSSSKIRSLLMQSRLDKANELLTSPFSIDGKVVDGKHIGRSIGFPTANIEPSTGWQLIPPTGVYAALVTTPDGVERQAMVNIGFRPTVTGSDTPPTLSIEANIFDWLGYIYGERVTVQFLKYIRKEKKFSSLDKLKSAIAADENAVRTFFKDEYSREEVGLS